MPAVSALPRCWRMFLLAKRANFCGSLFLKHIKLDWECAKKFNQPLPSSPSSHLEFFCWKTLWRKLHRYRSSNSSLDFLMCATHSSATIKKFFFAERHLEGNCTDSSLDVTFYKFDSSHWLKSQHSVWKEYFKQWEHSNL